MCTRETAISTSIDSKAPFHPYSTPSSSSASTTNAEKSSTESGEYGEYFDPTLPASKEMRNIVDDAISMAGGIAAILLRIAQPLVGAGAFEHSSFTVRPIERGRRSIAYIYVQAFGTLAERRYITDATHRSHQNIKSSTYDANDVDLQLWVASITYWSMVASLVAINGLLDTLTAERVHKEFSTTTTLCVPPLKWPTDLAAFDLLRFLYQ